MGCRIYGSDSTDISGPLNAGDCKGLRMVVLLVSCYTTLHINVRSSMSELYKLLQCKRDMSNPLNATWPSLKHYTKGESTLCSFLARWIQHWKVMREVICCPCLLYNSCIPKINDLKLDVEHDFWIIVDTGAHYVDRKGVYISLLLDYSAALLSIMAMF